MTNLPSARGRLTSSASSVIDHWFESTIPQVVEKLGEKRGADLALVSRGKKVSFGELAESTRRIACYLIENGVKAGDRVALLMSPSEAWAAVHYGVIAAGAIVVPMNLALRAAELKFVLGQCGPKCVICTETYRGESLGARIEETVPDLGAIVQDGRIRHPDLAALEFAILDAAEPGVRAGWRLLSEALSYIPTASNQEELRRRQEAMVPAASCAIVFTSGSTGFPKPALLHHRGLLGASWWYGEGSGMAPDDRTLSPSPTFHVSGISAGMTVSHIRGLPT